MFGGSGPQKRQKGYTIVEVLIFLAVSGLMFVVAASFVSGKQAKSEFRQGMNAVNDQVRQVINDVSNGYFPAGSGFVCSAGPSGPPTFPTNSPQEQGTNKGCVFMGKVIHFSPHGESRLINLITVAGRQYVTTDTAGTVPTSFSQARPTAVPGLTEETQLQWGLELTKATTGTNPINGVGFFSSFGSYDSSGVLASGNQSVVVVPITGTLNMPASAMEETIASSITDGNVAPNPRITLCFEGGNDQYGTLTIGDASGQGQRLATAIRISDQDNLCP
jgi:type II secretory pathway pseudopilin PulG